MYSAEVITPQHLTRKAVIYIRQSSTQQVRNHQESRERQYALVERAVTLGWTPETIDTIDEKTKAAQAPAQRTGRALKS